MRQLEWKAALDRAQGNVSSTELWGREPVPTPPPPVSLELTELLCDEKVAFLRPLPSP